MHGVDCMGFQESKPGAPDGLVRLASRQNDHRCRNLNSLSPKLHIELPIRPVGPGGE